MFARSSKTGMLLVVLISLMSILSYAQEPTLIMTQAPVECGLDLERGIYLAATAQVLYAYDTDSGAEKWSYSLPPNHLRFDASQTKDMMVLSARHKRGVEIIGIDIGTGTVCWKKDHHSPDNFEGIRVIPGSSWFFMGYSAPTRKDADRDVYFVLCDPEGTIRCRAPLNSFPLEWREEGKVLLLLSNNRLITWDLSNQQMQEEGAIKDGYFYRGALHDGTFLLLEPTGAPERRYVFWIADNTADQPLRSVSLPGQASGHSRIVRNGRALLFFDHNDRTLWLLDADTDELLFTLQASGHQFRPLTVREDQSGRVWVLSQDTAKCRHLWLLEPGATPRKVFDASPWLIGRPFRIQPPYVVTIAESPDEPSIVRAYDFERRTLETQWQSNLYPIFPVKVCTAMKRCAVAKHDRYIEVLERGIETPLLTLQGNLMAFSPTGEHVVAQIAPKELRLLQVSTGETIAEFPTGDSYRNRALFSDDGSRVALHCGSDAYSVIHLAEDNLVHVPLKFSTKTWFTSQSFSPDGTRLLSATRGRAWLHDTDTGEMLHTLVEPQRFRPKNVSTPEVMGIKLPIVNRLGDMVGNYTNMVNSEPLLRGAFVDDGSWIVTVAESQMIRLWDARSGRSLRTITPPMSNTRSSHGDMRNEIFLGHNGAYAFCFNSHDRDASFWDVKEGREIRRFKNRHHNYHIVFISDDGSHVFYADGRSLFRMDGRDYATGN